MLVTMSAHGILNSVSHTTGNRNKSVLLMSVLITLMIQAVSISETSVNFYETTRCDIPEDNYLRPNISPVITL
jgi:hypothetical protein